MNAAQRRGRRIMMTDAERDAYLTEQRTCRVATVSPEGMPHVSALWFVWDGGSLWHRTPEAAVVVDDGVEYGELRGVELCGEVSFVGEAPRTGRDCAELASPERLFAAKYLGLDSLPHDERHAWIRLTPRTVRSWDFTKLSGPAD
ncbi:pyridoxamine 5'-phosphate oxidase family protein [Streptomyces sp. S501]|uniref:pyridoxamine 5'-phosphate oxidase family protein n=1 Tax=Streptomyces sp. S501 TaxID=2420135 RepID=UPI00106E595D|nr:pyridoxamine 5'-phosphate oxidase family protein [Streptomyces sp. S501]QBR05296.1 pyridoxamine 5'-phosphate oxidase family protein [Streptomyces sp. S501]